MSNEIHGSSIVEASQPSAEIELPYKYAICFEFFFDFTLSALFFHFRTYSLVRFDGSPVERVDKHPFCMARVYYNEKKRLSGFRHLMERIAGNNLPPKSASWCPISVPERKKSM